MLQQLRKTSVECVSYAFTFCSFLFQIACIGRKSVVCENVCTMPVRSSLAASRVRNRRNLKEGRTMAMKNFKALLPKTVWVGTLGVAAMLLGWTPSCKAQEVSPAIFTDTGVEDAYPVAKPLAKKPARVQVAAHAVQSVASNDSNERKQNAHRVARKVKVTATPGL
jgi:hypothetical protein